MAIVMLALPISADARSSGRAALTVRGARVHAGWLMLSTTLPRSHSGTIRVLYTYSAGGRSVALRWTTRVRWGDVVLRKRLATGARSRAAGSGLLVVRSTVQGAGAVTLRTRLPYAPALTCPPAMSSRPTGTPGVSGGVPGAAAHSAPAAVTVPAPTAPGPGVHRAANIGVFEDVQYLTGAALSARLDAYKASGTKWVRFQLIWANVQSGGPNYYYWQAYDELIAGLAARGLKPLAVVGDTPVWARAAGCAAGVTCEPADPNAFANFLAIAVARYKDQGLKTWEIWNEPNDPIFWQPQPDAAAYTRLLRPAYAAVKAVDSQATVVSGGTASVDTYVDGQGRQWISQVDFLRGMYANGAAGSFDAVGDHPYTFPRMPGDVFAGGWSTLFAAPVSLRGLMQANGDGAKKVWATEFGAHTDPQGDGYVTESQQALMVTVATALWSSYDWAGPLIFYSFMDTGTDPSNRENFFGLVRADGTPKPALAAFEAAATGAVSPAIHAASACSTAR